jgi:uncharacterized protein
MSKTFVKDPRSIAKPGDVVRVRVLEVDEKRHRIALTMRLDDPVGASAAQPRSPERRPAPQATQRTAPQAHQKTAPQAERHTQPKSPKATPSSSGGALADALRSAGLGK